MTHRQPERSGLTINPFGVINRMRANMFRTFRGRLALLYVSLELGILLFAGVVLYTALANRVYNEVDEQLVNQAASLASKLEDTSIYFWSAPMNQFADHYAGAIQLISANGIEIFRSDRSLIDRGGNDVSRALGMAFRSGHPAFASTESLLNKANIRVIAFPIFSDGRIVATLMLGHSTADIRSVFNLMYLIGGILGIISILISAAAGYYMAKRALDPIQEITRIARAVAAGDLSRRLTSRAQEKEIGVLVRVLNKMFADLETSFITQKRFTADASHELRLPLTILKGEIEVALRHPRSEQEYQQILRQQLDMIDRIQRIVNDLLTLASADAGQLEMIQTELDLSLLLQEVGQQHLILFDSQHISLDMEIEDDLEIMGDATQIERTMMNLLSNAFKHAPEYSTIYLSAHVTDRSVIICVRDEGPGIAEEQQGRLFDRFYRADDARCRKDGQGAGLGLAICKRIVDAHDGDIWVKSRPGEGAAFFIRLPLMAIDKGHQQRLRHVVAENADAA
ncbi:sensor histidine kinase [Mariprofundus erugo]|uniref:sensor histidine kinase n=1 Tax=Mariprofundus erugo TaxID=2528639 RepID=UPI001EE9A87A|nr:HAMP domain-containing sensor histidine kinase [Mariprofundus erugo]